VKPNIPISMRMMESLISFSTSLSSMIQTETNKNNYSSHDLKIYNESMFTIGGPKNAKQE
jgi:hypothetical protein